MYIRLVWDAAAASASAVVSMAMSTMMMRPMFILGMTLLCEPAQARPMTQRFAQHLSPTLTYTGLFRSVAERMIYSFCRIRTIGAVELALCIM